MAPPPKAEADCAEDRGPSGPESKLTLSIISDASLGNNDRFLQRRLCCTIIVPISPVRRIRARLFKRPRQWFSRDLLGRRSSCHARKHGRSSKRWLRPVLVPGWCASLGGKR